MDEELAKALEENMKTGETETLFEVIAQMMKKQGAAIKINPPQPKII